MHSFRIRPGISHRSFAGCGIILDTRRDRYWKVDAGAAFALDWITGRASGPVPYQRLAGLEQLGLVDRKPADGLPVDPISAPLPQASAIEGDGPREGFQISDALEIAYLTFAARRALRRYSLHFVLSQLQGSRAPDISSSESANLARRFDRYRRLVPLANQCLPDTLAFLRFAARRGCFPTLVFGVEAWPFAAHCWAQSGDLVLNDVLDHARAFSPILAV